MRRSSRSIAALGYDVLLALASGFSLGFFAWIARDRLDGDGTLPMWPFSIVSIVAVYAFVRWMRRRSVGERWLHLLWVPVLLFVTLLTLIVMALRNFT